MSLTFFAEIQHYVVAIFVSNGAMQFSNVGQMRLNRQLY
jgi:hypothetical protein